MHTAGCQTGCTTRFDNRLNEQWLFVQHGCQTSCQTHLTTSWLFVYTIQPVVKLVVQPVVSCKRGFNVTVCGTITSHHIIPQCLQSYTIMSYLVS